MAADRARRFTLASAPGLTGEALDQLHQDVAELTVAYQQRPLPELLGRLVDLQDTLFTVIEGGRQQPAQTRQLLLLAGVTSGILAKVSHDQADVHTALTLSRTAFLCADQADHNGLRAWIRGLQSLITYWSGRYHDAIGYAQEGARFGATNSAGVWLLVGEARAWAALGNADRARAAIRRAADAREAVHPDELDELGGVCRFSAARELYYAADALAWLPAEASAAHEHAVRAVAAYADPGSPDWAFGDAAGAATDLAIARVALGEPEGAAEAVRPVLALPAEQRIHGIVATVNRLHRALTAAPPAPGYGPLQEEIEAFTAAPGPRALHR